jgi:cupin fold WbuC family metalloprotein
MHLNLKDKTNEMIIALNKKSFIAPHIHPNNKSESYFVIEGSMKVYVFSKKGLIKKNYQYGNLRLW